MKPNVAVHCVAIVKRAVRSCAETGKEPKLSGDQSFFSLESSPRLPSVQEAACHPDPFGFAQDKLREGSPGPLS